MTMRNFELDTDYDAEGRPKMEAGGHYVNLDSVRHGEARNTGNDQTVLSFVNDDGQEHAIFLEFDESGYPPPTVNGKSMKWLLFRPLEALDLPYVMYWKTKKSERKKYAFSRLDFEKAIGRRIYIELENNEYTDRTGEARSGIKCKFMKSLVRNPHIAEDDPRYDDSEVYYNQPPADQGEPAFEFGSDEVPF